MSAEHVGLKDDEIPIGGTSPQDTKVIGERVRSLLTRYWEIDRATHDQIGARPKTIESQVQWISGGPLGVVVPPGSTLVQITYTNATSTPAQIQAAVAAVPAADALLEIVARPAGATSTVKSAALGNVAATDLYTELVIPGAPSFVLNAAGRWVPYDGGAAGMAALLAVLNTIQTNTLNTVANTAPDNAYASSGALDLGIGRADVALNLAGRQLIVANLTGVASIKFNVAGNPLIPIYPANVYGNFEFTNVLLTNGVQPGLTLTLHATRRV